MRVRPPLRIALLSLLSLTAPASHAQLLDLNGNGVGLDFAGSSGPIQSQHYAFLVGESEFDAIFNLFTSFGEFFFNVRDMSFRRKK